ncbi:NDP-hexose 2,3-dehydratase family protein [Pseudonocardia nematodicida]|uniref:NDP-hexose 2,3-dehydratase family protein n=1 Tax=Pseudonocardia nematodicida TaxID=1206997 RepID=A0ABV1KEB5_9PSEU
MTGAPTGAALLPRSDATLHRRIARSLAAVEEGHDLRTDAVPGWLAERSRAHRFEVGRIPFAALDGWYFDDHTGDLRHRTGRFFSIGGLSVTGATGPVPAWQQPIIDQPEIGILGILAREFDGVLHVLVQAKMEPGNPGLVQLSPTVQATRSNYTGAHAGAAVRFLEHFTAPDPARVIADVLQSEHGAWFHRKFNRNMLVETTADVPAHEDFRWLTLGQVAALLTRDTTVNMDARTVLSCLPAVAPGGPALRTDAGLASWLTARRSRHDLAATRIPLARVTGWERDEYALRRPDDRHFHVVAVDVRAGSREVPGWTQPLVAPRGDGLAAFVLRRFDGVPHLLAAAKLEPGLLHGAEVAPTVQTVPGLWTGEPEERRPPFLRTVLEALSGADGAGTPGTEVHHDVVHSEEGGRFLDALTRYVIVELDDERAPLVPPPGFCWVTPAQLSALTGQGRQVNVAARTLVAALVLGGRPDAR